MSLEIIAQMSDGDQGLNGRIIAARAIDIESGKVLHVYDPALFAEDGPASGSATGRKTGTETAVAATRGVLLFEGLRYAPEQIDDKTLAEITRRQANSDQRATRWPVPPGPAARNMSSCSPQTTFAAGRSTLSRPRLRVRCERSLIKRQPNRPEPYGHQMRSLGCNTITLGRCSGQLLELKFYPHQARFAMGSISDLYHPMQRIVVHQQVIRGSSSGPYTRSSQSKLRIPSLILIVSLEAYRWKAC